MKDFVDGCQRLAKVGAVNITTSTTTNGAAPMQAANAPLRTYRVTYFSGKSRKIVAVNYDEAVLLAHRARHNSCVADITEVL